MCPSQRNTRSRVFGEQTECEREREGERASGFQQMGRRLMRPSASGGDRRQSGRRRLPLLIPGIRSDPGTGSSSHPDGVAASNDRKRASLEMQTGPPVLRLPPAALLRHVCNLHPSAPPVLFPSPVSPPTSTSAGCPLPDAPHNELAGGERTPAGLLSPPRPPSLSLSPPSAASCLGGSATG